MALNFNKFAEKGNSFMKELAKELGYPDDKSKAGRVLKAILHALRNHVSVEESVQLLAQLPMFLKAVYVENWTLRKEPKRVKHLSEFFEEIRKYDGKTANIDFTTDEDMERDISVVFIVLRRYISLGELEDIKAMLPKELKPLLNSVTMI